ncbi:integrase [Silvibacterium bohemicum]|uniref:Integrase n=1 Tax=Silvibacterium bohemicum TaxID=1577686 RepID=A0A841JZ99_9BACT|nr:tyrosine-type recombinase/integrase [Silvibacterium bohemicum]MBB6144281.1 integrase [Silvibacterium bohemicum]
MDSFVFTRHASDCKYKRDRLYRRCNCPKWVEARFNSERVRKSASTRLWDEAEQFRQKLEETLASGRPLSSLDSDLTPTASTSAHIEAETSPEMLGAAIVPSSAQPEPAQSPLALDGEIIPSSRQRTRVTIQKAVEVYMADARSRNLQTDTVKKLERLFEKQFLPWTKTEGLVYLDELDHNALLTYRTTWTEGMVVKAKKQDRVVGFFWESFRRGFITQNPALSLSKIRPKHIPTDYFPRDEFDRIIDAIVLYGDPRGGYLSVEDTRTRLHTLTLLMRWSGLRIRDAVTLERHRLQGDNLLLYQAKTGQSVYVPLPPEVVEALVNIPEGPVPNKRYFFWSGNGLPKSAVANWQRSFRRLFQLADIRKLDGQKKRCHPHMFRDTFAVEMLLAGVPIDQVSTLLGHSSVKVTERHYAPFVKARQLQLQASVRAAWKVGETPGEGPDNNAPRASRSVGNGKRLELVGGGKPTSRIA